MHGTVSYSVRCVLVVCAVPGCVCTPGVTNSSGKGPQHLLWAVSMVALVKITISGIPSRVFCFL
jgi:hypothetical protein